MREVIAPERLDMSRQMAKGEVLDHDFLELAGEAARLPLNRYNAGNVNRQERQTIDWRRCDHDFLELAREAARLPLIRHR
jgi:hypothetical protein